MKQQNTKQGDKRKKKAESRHAGIRSVERNAAWPLVGSVHYPVIGGRRLRDTNGAPLLAILHFDFPALPTFSRLFEGISPCWYGARGRGHGSLVHLLGPRLTSPLPLVPYWYGRKIEYPHLLPPPSTLFSLSLLFLSLFLSLSFLHPLLASRHPRRWSLLSFVSKKKGEGFARPL